jgi:hypothetical protein
MRSKFSIAAALVAALTAGLAAVAALTGPAARADQVYHSQHIALQPVGHEPLRSGFVENIHVNGPTIYAHEIYVLNGADPATTYQVTLTIFADDPTCAPESTSVKINTAEITTNTAGNGRSDAVFTPSDAAPLRHATHGAIWTVSDSSGAGYSTGCQVVTLD